MSVPSSLQGPPITDKRQLILYHEAGNKPPAAWRIGTEHEKFVFRRADLRRVPYDGPDGIRALLEGMTRFGWKPVVEHGNIIGLSNDSQCSITLEPGGQFELSGAPLATLHQTCGEVHEHLRQVREVCDELGLGMIGLGFDPTSRRDEVPWMPKGRYRIMRDYMPKKGQLGLDMMLRTCTVQTNLDYRSETDMVRKFRVSLALQPVAVALFANSPFIEGRPSGFQTYRSFVWTNTDPDRCFRDFMAGRLPALPGELPLIGDWADHLTTAFPEVRLKTFLEMRGADGGPWRRLCALPALWVGLLYDGTALDAASDLVADWSAEEREAMRHDVPRLGLDTPHRSRTLRDIALEVLDIAREGLHRRAVRDLGGEDETFFLDPLFAIAGSGRTPAAELVEDYHSRWGGDITRVYTEQAY